MRALTASCGVAAFTANKQTMPQHKSNVNSHASVAQGVPECCWLCSYRCCTATTSGNRCSTEISTRRAAERIIKVTLTAVLLLWSLPYAGAALQPQVVIDAVQKYQQEELLYGGYETAAKRADDLQKPYTALAQLLNCSPDEVSGIGS